MGAIGTHDGLKRMVERTVPEVGGSMAEAGLRVDSQGVCITTDDVLAILRTEFRRPADDPNRRVSLAMKGKQMLNQQLRLGSKCRSCTTTAGVLVEATSLFLHQQPTDVAEEVDNVFMYRIRIANVREVPEEEPVSPSKNADGPDASTPSVAGTGVVQLLGRHWHIEDASGKVQTVPYGSPGVVGHTPILRPGQMFEYCSYAGVRTETGTMRGSFQMVDEAGEPFDAEVPLFGLEA